MISKRRKRRLRGKLRAAIRLVIEHGDPRRAGLTSEMPDYLRALALEGLQAPYEADECDNQPDDFGRRLLAQKGSIPEDVDIGYGPESL